MARQGRLARRSLERRRALQSLFNPLSAISLFNLGARRFPLTFIQTKLPENFIFPMNLWWAYRV